MNGRSVLIVEKDHIIGFHLIQLLQKKGFKVYDEVLTIKKLSSALDLCNPGIIIINRGLFFENRNYLRQVIDEHPSTLIIILFAVTPAPELDGGFSFTRIKFIEKPFLNYQVANVVTELSNDTSFDH